MVYAWAEIAKANIKLSVFFRLGENAEIMPFKYLQKRKKFRNIFL